MLILIRPGDMICQWAAGIGIIRNQNDDIIMDTSERITLRPGYSKVECLVAVNDELEASGITPEVRIVS